MRLSIAAFGLLAAIISGCGSSSSDNEGLSNSSGSSSSSSSSASKAVSFDILHMNDIHSHLESENYSFYMNIDGQMLKVKSSMGGMARAATKIKALQAAYGSNALTINAGDLIQGTFYFTAFEGQATADMFNQIEWDIFELGNHEFDNGDAFLGTLLDKFNGSVDVLGANVVPDAGNVLENRWKPYVIKEIDGEKVGIVGIDIKQKTEVSSRPSPEIKFFDETTTAQKYIDELSAQGINKIVLVTHQGYMNDLAMASKLKGVDVIIGGDSHTLMGDFSGLGLTSVTSEYPKMAKDADGNSVCIAQAWQYSYMVGDVHVNFDADGKIASCEGRETLLMGTPYSIKNAAGEYIDVNDSAKAQIQAIIDANPAVEQVQEDASALAALQPYKEQLDAKKAEVIGLAKTTLGHNRIPYDKKDGKSMLPYGSDIAPVVCKSFMEEDPNADVCVQNAGGVRIAIDEGNITMDTAYTLLPFKNTLYEISMKGSEIKQVLEDALTNYIDNGGSTGSFPYAYALRYDVNASQSANHRISNLEVMDKTTKQWSAIGSDTMYTVITNNYISAGRDGYTTFKTVQDTRGEGTDTYLDYAMSFVDYVKNHTASDGGIDKLSADERPIKCYVDDKHPACPEAGTLYEGAVAPLNAMNFTLGSVKFGNGFELNATWGLGSAAAHKAGDDNLTFYTLTDRGVNIKCKDDEEIVGTDICEKGKIFPFPDFTPSIIEYRLKGEMAIVQKIIPLKDANGSVISGVSNPLSNFSEKAYDIAGNEMAYDPNGLDTESLAVLSDGSFWIGEEYAPSLVHADAEGKIIERLVPAGLESELSAATYTIKGDLPSIIAKRHANRGIESIAVSPDEKYLYFSIQSPLDNPDYGTTRNVRMYKMAIADHSDIKEFLYKLDLPDTFNKDNETKTRKQKDVKISEMSALEDGTVLVLERISATTKLYRVDFAAATPVPADKSADLETDDSGVTPMAKTKVFDTDLRDGFPSKVEGIAPLGNGKFLTINDNDFGIEGDDTVIKIADINVSKTPDKKQTKGRVVFFDTDGNFEKEVTVGILPDMVTYTHDGKKVLVANEGELAGNEDLDAPLYDPYGTVSIIDTATYDVKTVDFTSVTTAPEGSKIRKGAEIARDFEPEYIAVSGDDTKAWVTLQESNAVAKIDLTSDTLDTVFGLGFKDLSKNENAMDYKKDGEILIDALPSGVYGMYQPDTIAAYTVGGKDYFVIANEGDDRDDFYAETTKASKLTHSGIPDIGDLRVCPDIGDEDGDGDYEKLYAYGARSFAIFDGDTGALLFESGKEMAETVAARFPNYFNTRPKKGKWYPLDERSEKKGIEPEALALGTVDGKTYAYVGLEKQGGFFVYDITDPSSPSMVEYFNDIDYTKKFDYKNDPVPADIDDMAPEGSTVFTQDGKNYYVNANEVSGTVSVFEIAGNGTVTKKGTFRSGIYYDSATEIVEYDAATKRLFVTSSANNSIYVLDVSDVTDIKEVKQIDLSAYGTGVNSVSVHGGKIAVAVERSE